MKIDAKSPKVTLTFLFLVIIVVVRIITSVPILIGDESYYSLRISEEIKKDPIITNDPLGEDYSFSILHYLIMPLSDSIKNFIPLILGLLGGLYFYKSLDKNYRSLATAILFMSPLFLSTFTSLTKEMLAVFFVLLNLYNINNRKIISFTLVQTLLVLTSFEIWFLSTIYFVFKNKTYIAVIPGLLISPLVANVPINPSPLFSELGASNGYSLFVFMLAIIGFLWRKKNPSRAIFLLAGVVLSYYVPTIRILGTLIFVTYAARAINKLIARKWELPHIKQGTLFLVFLVLIFSASAKSGELISSEPYDVAVYQVLKNQERGLVLADQELGHYIQYYSNMPVVIDSKSSDEKVRAVNELIASQNLDFVKEELNNRNVKYVLIKTLQEDTGISFITEISSSFIMIYSDDTYELWHYNP